MNSKPQNHSAFRIPHSAFLLALVLLAPFAAILLHPAGQVLGNPHNDNPSMFYFINAFAGHCWRTANVPLWNPHIMLGLPFLGEGQAAIFHPLSWLFILLPTGVAINWVIALSFLLSGLFFYGYLRAIELSAAAAAGGALAWSFSTILGGRIYAGHLTILLELIEVPLVLMLWERYRQTRAIKFLAGLGLAYAAMILAAYPQFLYIFSLFFMLYVLIQAGSAGAREEGRAILGLGVFILLAIGIGAVQLLPSADFAAQSSRIKPPLKFCLSYSFPPENLFTLVAPRFFGYTPEAGPALYWGRNNFWEECLYFGILPLMLVVPGVLAAPRRRRLALIVCGLLFAAVSLGKVTPLFSVLYHTLPGINLFRGPSKFMLMTELCLVTFSAYGLDTLLRPLEERARRRLLVGALAAGAVMLLAIVALGFILRFNFGPERFGLEAGMARSLARLARGEVIRALLLIALAVGVIILAWGRWAPAEWRRALPILVPALILADLLWVFVPLLHTYDETITQIPESFAKRIMDAPYPARVLTTTHYPNAAMRYGYASASGYSGNTLKRFNTFVSAARGEPLDTLQVDNPIPAYGSPYRFLAFDFAMLPANEVPSGAEVLEREGSLSLIRFPDPFPRVFLAAAPQAAAGEEDARRYVRTPTNNVLASPVVESANLAGVAPAPLRPDEGARIVAFTPNRVEVETRAAQRRVLVLCEAFEKNWTAMVGGATAPVFPANDLFRGVVVPRGESRVIFEYRPRAFRTGAVISLLSLAGLLSAAFFLGARASSPAPNAECGMRNAELKNPPRAKPQKKRSGGKTR